MKINYSITPPKNQQTNINPNNYKKPSNLNWQSEFYASLTFRYFFSNKKYELKAF